jgi:hypothetical protein
MLSLRGLTFAATLALAASVDLEYPGFLHFPGWPTGWNPFGGPGTPPKLPSGGDVSLEIAKDICVQDPQCNALWGCSNSATAGFGIRKVDSDFDAFIAVNATSGVSKVPCYVEGGGGNYPSARFLVCPHADVFDVIASFQLPPDLIVKSCQQNPKCQAFLIKNDMSQGTLLGTLQTSGRGTGYFSF